MWHDFADKQEVKRIFTTMTNFGISMVSILLGGACPSPLSIEAQLLYAAPSQLGVHLHHSRLMAVPSKQLTCACDSP
jgi:hypothetical protein